MNLHEPASERSRKEYNDSRAHLNFDVDRIKIDEAVALAKSIENNNLLNGSHLAVLDARTLFPIHISKNFAKLIEKPRNEEATLDDAYLFNLIDPERLDFFGQLESWTTNFHDQRDRRKFDESATESQSIYGIPIITQAGNLKKIMSKRIFQIGAPDRLPNYIISSIFDVTYLHTGENIIGHYLVEQKGKPQLSKVFNSEKPEKLKKSLITEREIEVLRLVQLGNSSKKIAEQLSLSVNTVERHRKNILIKMETRSLVGAITLAKTTRLID